MSAALNPALLAPVASPAAPGAPATAPAGPNAPAAKPRGVDAGGASFAEVLHKTANPEPLHFSRHALERVQRRGIELNPTTVNRLQDGVGRAASKGSRDSVVLVDGTAFVVSVASRTVITAVGAEHMREHVFTNIDSAVIA